MQLLLLVKPLLEVSLIELDLIRRQHKHVSVILSLALSCCGLHLQIYLLKESFLFTIHCGLDTIECMS